jgi:outer membrane receptor protein involved in Fe transport
MANPNPRPARGRSPALAAAVSAVLSMAGTASAQTVTGLDEVIVTATKRAERLQDVPESITAFDSKAIAMRGLQQMDDLAKMVPGLSLGQLEPGGTTIVFRGVASSGIAFNAAASSALYLDEQPITLNGRNPDPRLIDIERIEALRGPQGTLYGASSQSGTLRVITNKPDTAGFDAWVDTQITQVDRGDTGYDVSAMVNVPLVADRFALRLVGFTAKDAGYVDNVLADSRFVPSTFDNSNVVGKDVNSSEISGGRAALRWDVTENVDATFGAIFQDLSADGHGDVSVNGADDLKQVRFEEESLDDKWYQLALTINASLPFGDAIFSASYFDRDFHYQADATDYEFNFNQSFVNAAYCHDDDPTTICNYNVYDFGGDPRGFATNDEQTEITTLEARLQSPGDSESRWGWLAGVFYSQEKGHTEFDSYIRGYQDTGAFYYFSNLQPDYDADNPLAPTETWFLGRYDTELEQKAVFGEVSFDVTENFTITAGGRWFDYDTKFALHQEAPAGFSGDSLQNSNVDSSENGTVAKLNFTYRIDDDRMVYATYSEGFRVGGSNPLRPNSVLPRTYDSDELQNYEIGAKTEWLDNRVRLNVSAYYMKWSDFAVQIEDPQEGVFQLGFVNLPSADIRGVEAEFAVNFSEQWQLDGSFSYNNAEVADAAAIFFEDPDLAPFIVTKGARLPLTPDWTATLGIEYRSPGRLLNAQPFARFDYAYQGESVNSLEGIDAVVGTGAVVDIQDAYQTGDFRFGLEGENWSGSIFVDNVWDERAELYFSNRWAVQRLSVNQPRTIGVQFRYEF